jgi:membrane-bound lytic murein transglycosylase A
MASTVEPVRFADLAGWGEDDHAAALAAFRRSCKEIVATGVGFSRAVRFGGRREDWLDVCSLAPGADDARRFFERNFRPYRVHDADRTEGLFTGYYEPEVEGRRRPSGKFSVPIYSRPADLVSFSVAEQAESGLAYGRRIAGHPRPYLSRREIELGALAGKGLEIVWLEDWVDAFFIHVQGSARVRLEDGSAVRLSYAAKSGLPYSGIASLLVDRGAFSRDEMSMQATRQWLKDNPAEARALMWENQSFVFFREAELEDPGLGALGAQHVQLTPHRSLAVDRSLWAFGTPVWLDSTAPAGADGRSEPLQRLVIAQDTGSAIKGLARGDVYWGFGEQAGRIAGRMKSPGVMTVLLPFKLAETLDLPR